MKKLTLSIAIALIALCNISTAQEVRLDSLWAKLGGVFAMKFSPDSKRLIIGENGSEGQIRVFDAQTGIAIDSIAHSDFVDFEFTPDGQQMMTIDHTTIKFYNSATYKLERTIPYDQGGLITFSSNASIVSLSGNTSITIFDIEKGEVLAKILRPDKYNISPNQTEPYFNGKVCFSADGKYIIGKYANILVQWDWRNTPDKPEQLIPNLPNRAIIGFSPDKTMFVQQANELWSIPIKKRLSIPTSNQNEEKVVDAEFTKSGKYLIWGTNFTLYIIDIAKAEVKTQAGYAWGHLAVSPDSSYVFRGRGNGLSIMSRITWNTVGMDEDGMEKNQDISIKVKPLPGNQVISFECRAGMEIPSSDITIYNSIGTVVQKVHTGALSSGITVFTMNTGNFASGNYFIRLKYKNSEVSQHFIITK